MFEAAEVGRKLSKSDYKAQVPHLRSELLAVQQDLRQAGSFPVIVLFAGVDTAGKSETANLLNEWMDPRWIMTRGYTEPSSDERERPRLWRYWRDLPPHGRIAIFLSAWYSSPILDRVAGRTSKAEFDSLLDQVAAFERTLTDDGAVILKFWMHLSKKAQRKRLREFEKDPLQQWRVTKEQWKHWEVFDKFVSAADRAIRRTSTEAAQWHIVEGEDERYRTVAVATQLRDAIRRGIARRSSEKSGRPQASARRTAADGAVKAIRRVEREFNVLDNLDLSQKVSDDDFDKESAEKQARLSMLQRRAIKRAVSTILVFEGWDAAGKGGAIRRVTASLDARDYQVIPIGAPTDEERAHHYLWRFWRHLSRKGRLTIFDRSWYGRVLVERVERFATDAEYMRAYGEINHFEEQLVNHGILVLKFWIHISKAEQLRRFNDRSRTSYKRWKITDEDWRNRKRWEDYTVAVNDMVERTSTKIAPWTLVEGNDKNFARIKVLGTLAAALDHRLNR
jgi:AMP-polyphosphate phosphotransferase